MMSNVSESKHKKKINLSFHQAKKQNNEMHLFGVLLSRLWGLVTSIKFFIYGQGGSSGSGQDFGEVPFPLPSRFMQLAR